MIVTRKKKETKSQLIIPRRELKKIQGWGRRRISVVITDPRSRHVILTRYPKNHKVWYETTLTRGMDFIPTAILKKAKIHNDTEFTVKYVEGDLIIRRVPNAK